MISSPASPRKLPRCWRTFRCLRLFSATALTFMSLASVPGGNSPDPPLRTLRCECSGRLGQVPAGIFPAANSLPLRTLKLILTGGFKQSCSLPPARGVTTAPIVGRSNLLRYRLRRRNRYNMVTQTRVNKVSDPATNRIIWSSAEGEVTHLARYVSTPPAARSLYLVSGGISALDTTPGTLLVKKIEFTDVIR